MSFLGPYQCDRCKKDIDKGGVSINFENQSVNFEDQPPPIFCSKDGVDLCKDCYLLLVDWIKNPDLNRLGSVE